MPYRVENERKNDMPPKFTTASGIELTENETGKKTTLLLPDGGTISNDTISAKEATFDVSVNKETIDKLQDLLWKITISAVMSVLKPKRIIHNRKNGSTIVIWGDGSKTMVRPLLSDRKSPYSAFTAALAKKIYGNNSQVNKIVSMTEEPMPHKAKKKEGESDS